MYRLLIFALFYLLLLLVPLALSFLGPDSQVMPPRPLRDEFAAGLAMVGFTAVLLEFFLLGRFRPLSRTLGSDLAMQAHQLLARSALVFLCLHPFLYSLWGQQHRPWDESYAQALRIGGGSWGLFTGLLALGALLAMVVLALGPARRNNYDRWRLGHGVLALGVLILGLHHTLASGRYAQLPALQVFWSILALLAAASWFGVYLLRPLLQKGQSYRLSLVKPLAERIWEIEITPTCDSPMRFSPGQFAWLKLGGLAPHKDHPFSISSAPLANGSLKFIVKEAGDFTQALPGQVIGTVAYVDGPYGNFSIPEKAQAIIMLAGGIGIASFTGLLADCAQRGERRPIRLIYAEHNPAQMVALADLCHCQNLTDFQLLPMVEKPGADWNGLVGRLDAQGLAKALAHPAVASMAGQAHYMVCGPAAMMDGVESHLIANGVPMERVQSEHFQYDFHGCSPRALVLRRGWLVLSLMAGFLSALVLSLRGDAG